MKEKTRGIDVNQELEDFYLFSYELEEEEEEEEDDSPEEEELDPEEEDDPDPEEDEPEEEEESDDPDEHESEDDPDPDDFEDEIVIEIAGEEVVVDDEEAKAPEWVKNLRKTNREQAKRIKELENSQQHVSAPVAIKDPGAKPKISDFDYDSDKFDSALSTWYENKKKFDDAQAEAKNAEERAQQEWASEVNKYTTKKGELGARDFDEVEEQVFTKLSQVQQGIIVKGSEDAAKVIYALGKNDKRLEELAKVTDPIKFAFAIAKLEKDMKVGKRSKQTPPAPEVRPKGAGKKGGAMDSKLERLRAEAEKTGDYTQIIKYKKRLKAKGA